MKAFVSYRVGLFAAVLLIVGAACGGGKTDFSESAARGAITALLQTQVQAYKSNNARAFYNTYSPQAQKNCSFDEFSKQFRVAQAQTSGKDVGLKDPSVDFRKPDSKVADVSFTMNVGSTHSSTTGVFVLVGGKWYEDDDPCD